MSCILHVDNIYSCPNPLADSLGQTYVNLFTTLFTLRCPSTDWCTYPDNDAPLLHNDQEFDYIVVGGGAAGSVIAGRLSENKSVSVLVLEAGHYPTSNSEIPGLVDSTFGSDLNWNYVTQPVENNCQAYTGGVCYLPAGKCLGGSTCINAMVYIRGRKEDYDSWEAAGNDNWGYDSIFKYFIKNENLTTPEMLGASRDLYGKDGDQTIGVYIRQQKLRSVISEAALELGVPTNEAEGQLGFFNTLQTIDNGIRASAGKKFLGKHRNRANLIVSLNSTVHRVTFDGNIATGVVASVNSKQLTLKAKREVIISAGSIKSPVILMNSGIGPRDHLEQMNITVKADLAVGKNLQDHFINFAQFVTLRPDVYENPDLINDLTRYLADGSGPFGGTNGVLGFVGFINTKDNNNTNYPNIQYHFLSVPQDDMLVMPGLVSNGIFPELAGEFMRNATKNRAGLLIWTTLLHPKSRGEILLNNEDPLGAPRIYPRYLSNDDDIETLLEGIRFAEKLVETAPFKAVDAKMENIPMGCDDFEFKSDDYWICAMQKLGGTVYHPVGTCKMGPSQDGGVVDLRLNVHGFKKLRVIDASIMPTITSGNTQAPSLMIGQKGADMIIEENQ